MTRRRRSKVRRAPKPKLLLDEGFPPRQFFPLLNWYCNVRHIKHDLKFSGLGDNVIYDVVALLESRILVTFNLRDFRKLLKPSKGSIIAVSQRLPNDQIDRKITSLVKRLKPSDLEDKLFTITGETKH